MKVSAEVSFYPLTDQYKPLIRDVIARLQSHAGIEVIPNRISTQLFGEFDAVHAALGDVMKRQFEHNGHAVFVVKWLGTDRRPAPESSEYRSV